MVESPECGMCGAIGNPRASPERMYGFTSVIES
jgi:hypothetical protein